MQGEGGQPPVPLARCFASVLDEVLAQLHEERSKRGGFQALDNMKAHLVLSNLQTTDEFVELRQASVWASNGGAPQVAEERVHVLVP